MSKILVIEDEAAIPSQEVEMANKVKTLQEKNVEIIEVDF